MLTSETVAKTVKLFSSSDPKMIAEISEIIVRQETILVLRVEATARMLRKINESYTAMVESLEYYRDIMTNPHKHRSDDMITSLNKTEFANGLLIEGANMGAKYFDTNFEELAEERIATNKKIVSKKTVSRKTIRSGKKRMGKAA